MISTQNAGKLTQSTIDEGRAMLVALRRLDMNVARWVKVCIDECGSKDAVRAEWKKHLGLDHDHASMLISCYDAWSAMPDKQLWVAVGLQGVNKLRTLRSDLREGVVEKIKAALSRKETVAAEDVRKMVDKVKRVKPSPRVVKFVAGRSDRHVVSGATVEAIRAHFKAHPEFIGSLPECAILELGLEAMALKDKA